MSDATVELRAIFHDEISGAIAELEKNMQAMKQTAQPDPEAAGQWDKLKDSFGELKSEVPGLGSAMNMLGTATKIATNPIVAIPAAFAAAAAGGLELAKSNMEAVVGFSHMSAMTGISINALNALKITSEYSGVGIETITTAVARFNRAIGSNSKGLKELGITAHDPIEALAQLADKMKATDSAQERARIGNLALGRSYKELMPLLIQGGDAIRKSLESHVISAGVIAQYEEMHKDTLDIGNAWKSVKELVGDVAADIAGPVLRAVDSVAIRIWDAAKALRQMMGDAKDADNSADVIGGFVNGRQKAGKQDRTIGKVSSVDIAGLKASYAAMGKEQKEAFLAGWDKGGGDKILADLQETNVKMKGLLVSAIGDMERTANDEARKGAASQVDPELLKQAAEDIKKLRGDLADEEYTAGKTGTDKQVAETQLKYDKMKELAHGNASLLIEIERDKNAAINELYKDYYDKLRVLEVDMDAKRATEARDDAKTQLATAQLKLDAKYIGSDNKSPSVLSNKNTDQAALDKIAMAQEIADAQGNAAKIDNIKQTYANKDLERERQLTAAKKELIDQQRAAQQKLFDTIQGGMQSQILLTEKGKFSMKEFGNVLKEMAEEAIARLISSTVMSVIQAALVENAWEPAAMAASIATFGGAAGVGSAALTTAMAVAPVLGHADGGIDFSGGYIAGEGGRGELIKAIAPTQITTSSQTTTNQGHTFNIYGSSLQDIERLMTRAGNNNKINRRQMSSNRG